MTELYSRWFYGTGDTVRHRASGGEFVVISIHGSYVWAKSKDGDGLGTYPVSDFIHPKTEAEKRRDLAVEEMLELDPYLPDERLGMMSRTDFCKTLYDNGFRKPKPLTDDVIERLIDKHQNECETLCSFEFARMIESYIRGETP